MGRIVGDRSSQPQVVRVESEILTEPTVTMRSRFSSDGIERVNVELFLRAQNVPLWERGGKRAFAKSNNMEFATDEEFVNLFKRY